MAYLPPMRPRSHYALFDEAAASRDAGIHTTRDTKCSQYCLVPVEKTFDPIVKPFHTPRPWRGGRGGGHGALKFRTNGRKKPVPVGDHTIAALQLSRVRGGCDTSTRSVCQRAPTVSIFGIRNTAQRSRTGAIRQTLTFVRESRSPKRN